MLHVQTVNVFVTHFTNKINSIAGGKALLQLTSLQKSAKDFFWIPAKIKELNTCQNKASQDYFML